MDLIRISGRVVVAGPDTTAFVNRRGREAFAGLRFRSGVLPRLLGIPAAGLKNSRVLLSDLGFARTQGRSLVDLATALASADPANETAPWSLHQLHHITHSLETGAVVADVAREVGWSSRTLQRQCTAVFGYGLRRCGASCGSGARSGCWTTERRRQAWPRRPATPTNRTCTARSVTSPEQRSRRCVRTTGRRGRPTCHRDR